MSQFRMFVDESGNTGSNFFDKEQPIYTLVSIATRATDLEIKNYINSYEKKFSNNDFREIKSKDYFKDNDGKKILLKLIDNLNQIKISISICVAEKKYLACIVFVEYIYDWAYNPGVSEMPQSDNHRRAVNIIYDNIRSDILDSFIKAMSDNNIDLLMYSINLITELIKNKFEEFEFLKSIELITIEMVKENIINKEKNILYDKIKTVITPNHMCFFPFFSNSIATYSNIGMNNITIIHDHTKKFEQQFKRTHELMFNSDSSSSSLKLSCGYWHSGRQLNSNLEFRDSINSPGIRIADLIASGINRAMRDTLNMDNEILEKQGGIDNKLRLKFCSMVLGCFPMGEKYNPNYIPISDHFETKLVYSSGLKKFANSKKLPIRK